MERGFIVCKDKHISVVIEMDYSKIVSAILREKKVYKLTPRVRCTEQIITLSEEDYHRFIQNSVTCSFDHKFQINNFFLTSKNQYWINLWIFIDLQSVQSSCSCLKFN